MAARLLSSLPSGLRQFSTHSSSGASLPSFLTSSFSQGLPEYIRNAPPTRITTLSNGLKVATEASGGEVASLGIYVNAGSSCETKQNNGVAHFLEHLIFKGTPKRSQTQLELHIENIGGSLNAYTTREHTSFFARVFKNDVAAGVDIIADILQNSLLDPQAIEAERSTILTEKSTVEEHEEEVVIDHLHSAAFMQDSLGLTILGPTENIQSLQRQQLVEYIQNHYSADRMVLVGTGAVDHDQLCKLADSAFASLPKTAKSPPRPAPTFFGAFAKDEEDTKPLAYLAFAAQSVEWSHKDHFAFLVLQALLGQWDRSMGAHSSSRLCEQVAHEGLAHSVSHFVTPYHQTGLFGVYAVAPEETVADLCKVLLNAWPKTAQYVSDADLRRAKNKVQASCLSLDGSMATMEEIGRQVLCLGRRMSPAEIYQRIESITAADIRRIAGEYLVGTPLAGAALGRVHELPDYNYFMAWNNRLLG